MEEREVELVDYLHVLWRQKLVVLVTFLAAVLAAYFISTRLPETYSAKTGLLLLPPLASELDVSTSGSTLTSKVCERLATSTDIVRTVASDIGLPLDTDIMAFSRRISISVQAFSMAGEQQFLLDAAFTASDPETSIEMAQAWILAFSKSYGELFQDRTARSYDYISQNAESTRRDLEAANARRTALLLDHPIGLLNSDIAALHSRYQANVTALAEKERQLDSNEARVGALEHELSQQASVVVLERGLDPDSLAIALQSGLSNRGFEELLGLRTQVESPNSTFVSLTSDAAYARASSEELRKTIEVLEVAAENGRRELDAKQKEAIETQAALDAIDSDVQVLQELYARLATKLQDARIALAETSGPIRVIDPPITPTHPASPGSGRTVPVAGILGLALGVGLAFVFDHVQRTRELAQKTRASRTLRRRDGDGPPAPGERGS